ncbi:hypothetical protein G6F50_018714 [Rhizopus delemar]|uniref:Uncharacterized protein n=1 Tax=Rhizopus delemar TaxID=936053 RepID=A0A9P7BXV2_9FUNG|nr:hypothetical protein G6F50_018714 [Rhizopus delemar]
MHAFSQSILRSQLQASQAAQDARMSSAYRPRGAARPQAHREAPNRHPASLPPNVRGDLDEIEVPQER